MHATDDGPRKGTTIEGLGKLKTIFKADGSVTAGTSSQVPDGAAAVVLMRRSKATDLGLKPIGVMRGYKVTGCQPDEMGVGPAVAIPAVLEQCNLTIDDVGASTKSMKPSLPKLFIASRSLASLKPS